MISSRLVTRGTTAIALLLLAALCATPSAAQESFRATHVARINASEETQEIDDQIAVGLGIFRLDPVSRTLEYRVSVTGLANITAAHIHRAPRGEDGPVVIPLAITDDMHTASGSVASLSQGFVDSLLAGNTYVNVHTAAHPAGHIRGQITALPNGLAQMNTTFEPHQVMSDSGTGMATLQIDEASRQIRYHVDWNRLTQAASAAHFHLGAPGQAGPPVHTIALPSDTNITEASGVWDVSAEHFEALKSGLIYVNVHTPINPQGEIRGMVLLADLYTAAVNARNETPDRSDSSNGVGTATALVVRSPLGGGQALVSSVVDHTTGPVTMAHIHRGPIGTPGPVAIGLDSGFSSSVWDALGSIVTPDDLQLFAASGMYANYHTARFPGGEIRGQMIPAQSNLSAPPLAVPPEPARTGTMVAWHDRDANVIGLRLPADHRGAGVVELYSAIGVRAATAPATPGVVRVDASDIPAGAYFARLVVDGRPVASAKVVVGR